MFGPESFNFAPGEYGTGDVDELLSSSDDSDTSDSDSSDSHSVKTVSHHNDDQDWKPDGDTVESGMKRRNKAGTADLTSFVYKSLTAAVVFGSRKKSRAH